MSTAYHNNSCRPINNGLMGLTLKRLALILLMIVCGVGTTGAQQYVFLYKNGNTYNFLYYNNGNVGNRTDFDASTCVFTSTGSTQYYITSGNQNRYLRPRTGSNTYNLNFSTSTNYATWTPNGNKVVDYYGSYRLRYNNNSWSVSTTDSQNEVLFSYSTVSATAPSTPTITGNSTIAFSNSATYTASSSYTPEYSLFQNSTNTRYYYYNGNMSTTAPSSTSSGITYQWELSDGSLDDGHVRINSSTGLVEYYNTYNEENHNVTIRVTATGGGNSATNTKTIVCNDNRPISAPTGITATDKTISMGSSWTIDNYTLTAASGTRPYNYITASSADVTIASVTNNAGTATITGLAIGTSVITIKAYGTDNSTEVCSTTFTLTVKEPETGVDGNIVTLNDYEDHNWAYYNKELNSPIRSWNPADVKITYFGDGIVMTGNADYTATSTDFVQPGNSNYVGGAKVNVGGEDENTFVYYKTLERTDGSTSDNPTGRCLYTTIPNPFQVRPTYGSLGSTEPNNFTGWRGFQCWRLKSVSGGSVYSAASGGDALATGAIINAETEIYFAPTSEYGMKVELEAVWARAYLVRTSNSNKTPAIPSNNVGVERNFVILATGDNYRFNGTSGNYITNTSYSATISCYYPNGTVGNANATVTGNTNSISLGANTKFENVKLNVVTANTYYLTANGYDLIVGRGCSSTTVGQVRGLSGNTSGTVEYTMRLESGTFGTFNMIDGTTRTHSGTVSAKTIFGSDYDRAKSDNDKLSIGANNTVYGASSYQQFTSNTNRNNLTYDWNIKSGKVQASKGVAAGSAAECIYMGNSGSGDDSDGNRYQGKRRMIMEGGEVCNIAGGLNNYGNSYATYIVNDGWALQIRIKGGTVRGSVYGAAEFAGASGDRQFIITGGTINGWVAGGANGTRNDGGELYGSTALYIGGTAVIGSENGGTHVGGNTGTNYGVNGADGGHVFGAGCGILPHNGSFTNGTVGRVNNSIVAVADETTIWRDVYGGGNYGWVRDDGTTGIYILGGTVNGSVFGGSNNQQGQNVTITMKGGVIKGNTIGDATKIGGLYGGSNSWGTINDNVTMYINGGQVGTPSKNANIHGGGYGSETRVSQNVDITLGAAGQTEPGVTVYGDVYGGSALGYVNGTDATTTYHTNVTLNKGTINGSLYGGGLGNAGNEANVYGPVTVTVNGGSVKKTSADGSGGVYGANNINGAPQRAVTVTINGTDPAPSANDYALYSVYGGGNQADYTYGNGYPTVTVNNCDNSIEYVYGGGNAAAVAATDVTIYGGNTIGNVFGGGNGTVSPANVTGNTLTKIYGGTIGRVFGGSNSQGSIGGTIKVRVNKTGSCLMKIGELYGGGNMAPSAVGSIDIGCTGDLTAAHANCNETDNRIGYELEGIGDVYGGANAAEVTGDVTLTIDSGMVYRVFGNNNTADSVTGTITVNIDKKDDACGWYVGYVYGGGNQAPYSVPNESDKYPAVYIKNGLVSYHVFGGGLGSTAKVTGNPTVTLDGTAEVGGNVYGGGNAAAVKGNTKVTLKN